MPYVEWPNGPRFGIDLDEILNAIKNLVARSTPHLNYDFGFIRSTYANESNWLKVDTPQGAITALYTLLFDYRDRRAKAHWGRVTVADPYTFPAQLEAHKEEMVAKFRAKGRIEKNKGNRFCPRMFSMDSKANGEPHFKIQKAEYFHQVGTNLTPDEPLHPPLEVGTHISKSVRLWDQDQARCHLQLPPLPASRLANTIGVAVGITACDRYNHLQVLRRKRTGKVAKYENEWHVPFSFALAWDEDLRPRETLDLRQLIARDYGHEFGQELPGLEITDFHPVRPLALCRDMAGAGKPQFFFELRSRLPVEDLQKRIRPDVQEYKGTIRVSSLQASNLSTELIAFSLLVNRQGLSTEG